jgi:DNA-binding MarR family transcriptional regulator
MERLGLPREAFPLIVQLLREDDVSQDELVNEARIDKGTVARHLMTLEEAGLVRRIIDDEDRRVKRVHVTDRARDVEPKIELVVKAWGEKLMDGFAPEEKSTALGFLRRMAENVRQHWEEVGEAAQGDRHQ